MKPALWLVAFACLFATAANARPIESRSLTYCAKDQTYRHSCGEAAKRIQRLPRVAGGVSIIGGRPKGCPHAYCGCGAARYLGLHDARLNLAWNWARLFPRARPGPGMAVVWHHHIALIESMVGPHMAVLRDYNSGRGLSRIHVRSIAGAVVVNPGARMAGL